MHNYTPDDSTFHTTIPNVDDGDSADAGAFNDAADAAADNAAFLQNKLNPLYAGGDLQPATQLNIKNSASVNALHVEDLVVDLDLHVEGEGQFDEDVTVDGDLINAVTTPFRDGGDLNPSARLLFGLNVATALYVTALTASTPATIGSGAFRRMYTHANLGGEIIDTLNVSTAVEGDWVIIRQAGSGGISVKTATGPTEIAVLGPSGTNSEVGYFYFESGNWHLGFLMSTGYST